MKSSKLYNNPKQYIQGWVEFYKLKFKVTPDVLIPRPETELLVDEVLSFIQTTNYELPTILDLGTGCGNIAISIAKNLPAARLPAGQGRQGALDIKIIATDISPKALKVAKQNAKLHGVNNMITFIQSNLLSFINNQYDVRSHRLLSNQLILVTNLPYVPSERIPYLNSSVKDFEPHIALDGGPDGFELYRKLFAQIKRLNWKPGLIAGEIDYTHGELAVNEAQKYFPKARVEVKTDLAHKQRVLIIEQ